MILGSNGVNVDPGTDLKQRESFRSCNRVKAKNNIKMFYLRSSFLSLYNKELNSDSKRLNNNAHQKPSTVKPLTSFSANNIIAAFITNRKRPNVKRVIGKVRKMKIGFTIALSIANTIATIIADQNESN
jgi:hypothetical protein